MIKVAFLYSITVRWVKKVHNIKYFDRELLTNKNYGTYLPNFETTVVLRGSCEPAAA